MRGLHACLCPVEKLHSCRVFVRMPTDTDCGASLVSGWRPPLPRQERDIVAGGVHSPWRVPEEGWEGRIRVVHAGAGAQGLLPQRRQNAGAQSDCIRRHRQGRPTSHSHEESSTGVCVA